MVEQEPGGETCMKCGPNAGHSDADCPKKEPTGDSGEDGVEAKQAEKLREAEDRLEGMLPVGKSKDAAVIKIIDAMRTQIDGLKKELVSAGKIDLFNNAVTVGFYGGNEHEASKFSLTNSDKDHGATAKKLSKALPAANLMKDVDRRFDASQGKPELVERLNNDMQEAEDDFEEAMGKIVFFRDAS
jgi:hypothetical protein